MVQNIISLIPFIERIGPKSHPLLPNFAGAEFEKLHKSKAFLLREYGGGLAQNTGVNRVDFDEVSFPEHQADNLKLNIYHF